MTITITKSHAVAAAIFLLVSAVVYFQAQAITGSSDTWNNVVSTTQDIQDQEKAEAEAKALEEQKLIEKQEAKAKAEAKKKAEAEAAKKAAEEQAQKEAEEAAALVDPQEYEQKKQTEETKKKTYEKPVYSDAKMTFVSATKSGDSLVVKFTFDKSVSGYCKAWIKNGDGKSIYEYSSVNGTSCTVTLNVAGKTGAWTGIGYLKDSNYKYQDQSGSFKVNL